MYWEGTHFVVTIGLFEVYRSLIDAWLVGTYIDSQEGTELCALNGWFSRDSSILNLLFLRERVSRVGCSHWSRPSSHVFRRLVDTFAHNFLSHPHDEPDYYLPIPNGIQSSCAWYIAKIQGEATITRQTLGERLLDRLHSIETSFVVEQWASVLGTPCPWPCCSYKLSSFHRKSLTQSGLTHCLLWETPSTLFHPRYGKTLPPW